VGPSVVCSTTFTTRGAAPSFTFAAESSNATDSGGVAAPPDEPPPLHAAARNDAPAIHTYFDLIISAFAFAKTLGSGSTGL
jgi:hypothetical protein